uniref:Putative secreted protein n=1 Tax=Anopheles darlingi TaxID=43151 RepID=A0A2M4DIM7_ANODA
MLPTFFVSFSTVPAVLLSLSRAHDAWCSLSVGRDVWRGALGCLGVDRRWFVVGSQLVPISLGQLLFVARWKWRQP